LSFGVERIKSQGRFSASAQSGNDTQSMARDIQANILQVIHPGAFYAYVILRHGL